MNLLCKACNKIVSAYRTISQWWARPHCCQKIREIAPEEK